MTGRLDPSFVDNMIRAALDEDLGLAGDITSDAVIPQKATASVVMAARSEGRIAGLGLAARAFSMVDPGLSVKPLLHDGVDVNKDDVLLEVSGNARAILKAERVALNFAGHMSGIATLTRNMQNACRPHKARIAATRKTLPGLRALQKYAVVAGGGLPHRFGLFDAILIKDNHIAMAGGIRPALLAAAQSAGHTVKIEIEVDTLDQLGDVLELGIASIVMLDNMTPETMSRAVAMARGLVTLEASGGVTLAKIPAIAATGVDLISSGFITHSAPNLDLGLDFRG